MEKLMIAALGFGLAGLAGLSLGLIGGGGSLLTVPILVYGFQISTVLGSSYALFVVGITATVGALAAWRRKQVNLRIAALFLPASIPAAYVTRKYLLHALPESINLPLDLAVSRDALLMGAFGLLMVLAAGLSAVQTGPRSRCATCPAIRIPVLILLGAGVGALSGLFGAGGGFLIVPALILTTRLDMRESIGTSLAIVSANAWFSLAGDLHARLDWDWPFIIPFTLLSLGGMLLGRSLGSRIPAHSLRGISVAALFLIGLFIFLKEVSQGVPWF
jgi:uncharacterized protein